MSKKEKKTKSKINWKGIRDNMELGVIISVVVLGLMYENNQKMQVREEVEYQEAKVIEVTEDSRGRYTDYLMQPNWWLEDQETKERNKEYKELSESLKKYTEDIELELKEVREKLESKPEVTQEGYDALKEKETEIEKEKERLEREYKELKRKQEEAEKVNDEMDREGAVGVETGVSEEKGNEGGQESETTDDSEEEKEQKEYEKEKPEEEPLGGEDGGKAQEEDKKGNVEEKESEEKTTEGKRVDEPSDGKEGKKK